MLLRQRIPGDRVDREVAAPRRVLDRHLRIADDDEAAMSASRFRVAPRQRHVDAGDLVDLKAFTHRFHSPERFEDRSQSFRGDAEDFDVDVRRFVAEQPIAHPAADDQRAAAGVADRDGDVARAIERRGHL
jgi:hypothetical protein